MTRPVRPTAVLGVLLACATLSVASAAPAFADARVTVRTTAGSSELPTDRASSVRVSGAGFQSVPKAFGGIYVFFGTVANPSSGSWRPSGGGATGGDYRYIPDTEDKTNRGYQRYVAFPGSDTSEAANGGTLSANGSWSTTLTVPGATFTAQDRHGRSSTVDCRKVTCGIITIGAHGVKNARNETFTPVRFAGSAASGGAAVTPTTPGAGAGAGAGTGTATGTTPGAALPRTPAVIGVDQATAVAGRVLSFTARGFQPGEQVNVSLDDGIAAVGPLLAGAQGEVAAVIELPQDLRAGTHVLKATGAATTSRAVSEFSVTSAQGPAPVAAVQTSSGASVAWVAVAAAATVLLVVVLAGLVGAWRQRRGTAATRRQSIESARAEAYAEALAELRPAPGGVAR